ncbi:TetR/AcrR family transcriptional regulator [Xylanimonas ulmi]|uniref:TetR family transcriptional regulator n=1 Tax=Xylanimonas ulmi TaxID=228973 RepID=A0A4Q7M5Q2_9MICO|nr:TetR/AcrR family transcriptional regulator [Xylanibacterium ulmi]RZS61369.1 TetR family transcriptional regulator [Xylanibacterium ulmi]
MASTAAGDATRASAIATDSRIASSLEPQAPDASTSGLFGSGASTARGARTRERLVAAAATCFAEYGYTRTRISDIVGNAGVSQGSFYRHFANKGEALLAVIEPCVRDLLCSTRRLNATGLDDREALVRSTVAYFTTYAQHRHLMRVTREASSAQDGSGFAESWLRIRAEFTERTARWLRRLEREGRIDADRATDLVADALGAMTDQLAYTHIGLPARAPRVEELQQLGRVVGELWYQAVYGSRSP